jgi:glycosyltransferase involved in cell wall biosynthesis
MSEALHSVIVPVLNGARYIGECIASILPQLGPSDELIIVDNGSTDDTVALVSACADPRIVLLHEPRLGTPCARNTGLRAARGRYISFQDHDDLWPPGRQQALLHALTATPGANAAHGRQRIVFDGVPPDPYYTAMDGQHVLLVSIVTAIFERCLVKRIGMLDETMGVVADVDYLVRLNQGGMVVATSEEVVHICRRHGSNSTAASSKTIVADTMQILRRNIARKRENK